MSSAVAELEAGLQAMLALKPPGVSGSRIQSLTALCQANVLSESVLIQKLYTHFKKAPGTHKLGVLYVVDSVTRKWTEQAKANAQTINSSAPDGTYAAGVHRVTELLPVLMNDIVQSSPNDQKDKIRKLVDIWEKGQTFPLQMLTSFKEKLSAPPPKSTTPEGTPPQDNQITPNMQQPSAQAVAVSNTSSILEALANMARQNTSAPTASANTPASSSSYSMPSVQNVPAQMASMNPSFPFTPSTQSVNVPAPTATFASQSQGSSNSAQNLPSNPTVPYGALAPPLPQEPNAALQQQILLFKTLAEQGIPQDQWAGIIAALNAVQVQGVGNTAGGLLPQPQLPPNQAPNGWGARTEELRDRNGYIEPARSPPGRYRRRSRSPSPPRTWSARDSPSSRRRDEPGYGDYDRGRDSPGRGHADDRRGRGNEYRQRSPRPRRGRSPTPPTNYDKAQMTKGEKWVEYDPTIGKDNIKVLSRTLFVGGVTSSEHELRDLFNRFGKVQTCIVNKDKRHAFVKMVSRRDAVAAKDAMESNRTPDSQLRVRSTRWGVGFGPRDCSDYQTGISIIPISKLTDADRKWMLTAEYGGSGGKPIEGGMVVEEPDIEIGQGVSSKAISRRMQTDKGGHNGPKSSRDREEEDSRYRRDRTDGRRDDDRNDRGASYANPPGVPPAIPGFQYQMPTLPNGMPMFPTGFVFPGQNQHPPPPGHRS